MKNVIEILALIFIVFGLLIFYGLGMYLMYMTGWHKAFYLSVSSVVALILLGIYVNRDINKMVKKDRNEFLS